MTTQDKVQNGGARTLGAPVPGADELQDVLNGVGALTNIAGEAGMIDELAAIEPIGGLLQVLFPRRARGDHASDGAPADLKVPCPN